jgi:hypothetical protein
MGQFLPRHLTERAAASPAKLPRRSFAIEAVRGHKRPHALQHNRQQTWSECTQKDRLAAVSPKSDQVF